VIDWTCEAVDTEQNERQEKALTQSRDDGICQIPEIASTTRESLNAVERVDADGSGISGDAEGRGEQATGVLVLVQLSVGRIAVERVDVREIAIISICRRSDPSWTT